MVKWKIACLVILKRRPQILKFYVIPVVIASSSVVPGHTPMWLAVIFSDQVYH